MKPFLWENGPMKTTVELPDDLMRAVKIRAAHSNRKLKDVLVELLQRGLAGQPQQPPSRPLPKLVRLRGKDTLTIETIEAAINSGRE